MDVFFGFKGKFKGIYLNNLIEKFNLNNPSGIYFSNNVFTKNILDDEYSFGMIYDDLSNYQPVEYNNLKLVFSGKIYNLAEISDFLGLDFLLSDSITLIHLIDFYFKNKKDLLIAVEKALEHINGDYCFGITDGKNLAISQDYLGMKPLFYSNSDDIKYFASEKNKTLSNDFKLLKPGTILYNWEEMPLLNNIWDKTYDIDPNYVENIEKLLRDSINLRINKLDEIALIFSGGVDSTIIAHILKEISNKRDLDIKLYTLGVKESPDIKFSKEIAKSLDLDLKIQIIDENIVRENFKEVYESIGENNLMKLGVGMTMFLGSKMVKEDNFKVALSGQGADELFGGYNRYLKTYESGLENVNLELRYDIENMYHVNLERDYSLVSKNSISVRHPYLDKNFVEYALNIPVQYKIDSSTDKIRKHILRELACKIGINDKFAYRPKKAAQYGTGIDKILRKKILKDTSIDELLN